jgi:hypothetical protein
MARYHGEIGYGVSTENPPNSGVWVDTITERTYFGDVVRNTVQSSEGERLNNDISVSNSISVVADAYAYENFHAIRYIKWMGSRWTVQEIEVQSPRLILRLGGVYNGPTPS